MKLVSALAAVVFLIVVALVGGGAAALQPLFLIAIPYAAVALFLFGILYRVVKWARSPVPYRIPTTCGQQKALEWIPHSRLESPSTTFEVLKRMFLEVFLFRSLFRNTRTTLRDGNAVYGSTKWLWLGALAFHYAFFTILIRHFRFFLEPVPGLIKALEAGDGFLQIGMPPLYQTDVVILAAVAFLFLRRLLEPQVRYISLAADYFPLALIFSIVASGILMRYYFRVDVVAIKELAVGLATFSPAIPPGIGAIFSVHLLLVSALVAYFPFSKLTHAPGVFLSPTRNLANNNRAVRHINPWNHDVYVHTYAEWEEEFHTVLKAADFPLDKEYKE